MPDLIRLLLSIRLLSSLAIAGAPASATAAELDIVNASGTTIHELYVAAAGERSWGPDRLRSKQPNVIARGETHRISDLAPGSYQVMLVDQDGSECEIDSVDIASTYRIEVTDQRLRECTSSH